MQNILSWFKAWLLTKVIALLFFGCNSPRPHNEEGQLSSEMKVTTADIRYVEKSKKMATYPSVSDANLYDIDRIGIEENGPLVTFVIPDEMGNGEQSLWIALGHWVPEGARAFQYEKLHVEDGFYRYTTGVVRDEEGNLRPLHDKKIVVEYIFIWNDRKVAENNIRATGFGQAQ